MYGTTLSGGSGSGGTVYALTKSNGGWMESIVNNFVDYSGGIGPIGDVTFDKKAGALDRRDRGRRHQLWRRLSAPAAVERNRDRN